MRTYFLAVLAILIAPAAALAQPQADELPRIRISDPNRDLFRLGLPNAIGDAGLAAQALEIERRDLDVVGLFNLLNPASFTQDLQREGLGFSSALWSQVGAQGVAKLRADREGGGFVVEGKLYQVGRGDAAVLGKTFRGPELRPLVHMWVNEVIAQFTGVRGVFGSRIAYATGPRGGEIASVGADGAEAKVLTGMKSPSMLPAYAPNGTQIAFTSYLRGTPDLWIVSSAGGRAHVVSKQQGMNSGASWAPGGGQIFLTLSFEGNAELYRISPQDGHVLARLTHSPFIDMSASASPDGGQLAFVSDRGGSAQIYVMSSSGGDARRLTFQGNNNTTPRWNPRPDKPLIAFTGRDERGAFDVFIYDLRSKTIDRVTQNLGSNQSPDWSPDGRLLVYSSSRGGLWVMNPETHKEIQLSRGTAASPSWGPPPR
jgi:TolB protein